ncbi:hypothetical protein GCM10010182_73640 [Actinomadura cremea]|nr:hypothetical protein GCM10010182_73640 [Actinomadura cremea]
MSVAAANKCVAVVCRSPCGVTLRRRPGSTRASTRSITPCTSPRANRRPRHDNNNAFGSRPRSSPPRPSARYTSSTSTTGPGNGTSRVRPPLPNTRQYRVPPLTKKSSTFARVNSDTRGPTAASNNTINPSRNSVR